MTFAAPDPDPVREQQQGFRYRLTAPNPAHGPVSRHPSTGHRHLSRSNTVQMRGCVMTADVTVSEIEDSRTIEIRGRFDFGMQKSFRSFYQDGPDGIRRFVVNLRDTEYMDSSALGMLLLLREHALARDAEILIVHSRPEIRRIFEIANFDKLFKLG